MADPTPASLLRKTFSGAYLPYVRDRLAGLGIPEPPGFDAALDAGHQWLESELDALLGLDFAEQRRSPLEVFQEAMRFPTAALQHAGVEPVSRDPAQQAALPGDSYDLAPASSQVLGEDAWRAHLAWGAAKARALAGEVAGPAPAPPVVIVSDNLMDRTAIEPAIHNAGLDAVFLRSIDRLDDTGPDPVVTFVDLEHPEADGAIRRLAARSRVIAYGPHVDDFAMVRAQSLGADEALPRSRFFRKLPELLPRRA